MVDLNSFYDILSEIRNYLTLVRVLHHSKTRHPHYVWNGDCVRIRPYYNRFLYICDIWLWDEMVYFLF